MSVVTVCSTVNMARELSLLIANSKYCCTVYMFDCSKHIPYVHTSY